jgi:hypothetical protein
MSEPLSPDAQAVLEAFHRELPPNNEPGGLTAALREAVDRVVPENPVTCEAYTNEAIRLNLQGARSKFLAIAAELEGGNTTLQETD